MEELIMIDWGTFFDIVIPLVLGFWLGAFAAFATLGNAAINVKYACPKCGIPREHDLSQPCKLCTAVRVAEDQKQVYKEIEDMLLSTSEPDKEGG